MQKWEAAAIGNYKNYTHFFYISDKTVRGENDL